MRFRGIHLREIYQEILQISIWYMSLKITDSILQSHFSGAYELIFPKKKSVVQVLMVEPLHGVCYV